MLMYICVFVCVYSCIKKYALNCCFWFCLSFAHMYIMLVCLCIVFKVTFIMKNICIDHGRKSRFIAIKVYVQSLDIDDH